MLVSMGWLYQHYGSFSVVHWLLEGLEINQRKIPTAVFLNWGVLCAGRKVTEFRCPIEVSYRSGRRNNDNKKTKTEEHKTKQKK